MTLAIGSLLIVFSLIEIVIFLFLLFNLKKKKQTEKVGEPKRREGLVIFAIILVLVILLWSIHPFGYHKNYTITINENGIIKPSASNIWFEDAEGNKAILISNEKVVLAFIPETSIKNMNIDISAFGENYSKTIFYGEMKSKMDGEIFKTEINNISRIKEVRLSVFKEAKLAMTTYVGP